MVKIMLVDDEERSRRHIAEFLRRLGHEVMEKSDGREALDTFPSMELNLVLTDNRMPRMSGLELLRQIRSMPNGQDVDMVIYSAYGNMQDTIEAIRVGAYDFLLKPLNIDELVDMIERVAIHQGSRLIKAQINHDVAYLDDPIFSSKVSTIKVYEDTGYTDIVAASDTIKTVFQLAQRLHQDRSIPVLIQGETGTGKELVAHHIHYGAENINCPFVAINCATIPPATFESELFGYEAGSFSGGLPKGKRGKLDIAEGGTLFLDEISEIPLNLQAKLLRVLQEKEFYRVGGLKAVRTNVRVICASNQNLKIKVDQGQFRQDLYYRLNVGHLYIPALRQRREDIIPLATKFLQEFAEQKNKNFKNISKEAAELLLAYDWPGNVRELRNVIEWVTFMWDEGILKPYHLGVLQGNLPVPAPQEIDMISSFHGDFSLPSGSMPLNKFSNDIILEALKMHNGNKTETARYLGISRSSLYYRLKHM